MKMPPMVYKWQAQVLGRPVKELQASAGFLVLKASYVRDHPYFERCQNLPREAFALSSEMDVVLFVTHRWIEVLYITRKCPIMIFSCGTLMLLECMMVMGRLEVFANIRAKTWIWPDPWASKYKQRLDSLFPCGTRAKKLMFRRGIMMFYFVRRDKCAGLTNEYDHSVLICHIVILLKPAVLLLLRFLNAGAELKILSLGLLFIEGFEVIPPQLAVIRLCPVHGGQKSIVTLYTCV